ncbi:MAG: L,D-transpeptidase [Limnochordia bacterium]|jgi:lipoprotein-anchoring transpeptidase ErfK/SrfK
MRFRTPAMLLTMALCAALAARPADAAFPTPSITLQPESDVWSANKEPGGSIAVEGADPLPTTPGSTSVADDQTVIRSQTPALWVFDPMARYLSALDSPDVKYEIVINLPALRLLLYEHGQVIREYPIAVGNILSQSLLGTTRIINKVSNPTYYPPNWATRGLKPIPPGPDNPVGTFWLGLEWKGYGIHGTNNPASIGTAQSAGCIRMYNADVEALGRIVPINTPVTFVYEPVILWRDPITRQSYIAVYPDIYDMGTPSVTEIAARLHDIGVDAPVHADVLEYLLHKASGKPELLPIKTEVQIGGLPPMDGYRQGDLMFVSLPQLSQLLDLPLELRSSSDVAIAGQGIPSAWAWKQMAFAPVDTATVLRLIRERYDHAGR